MRSTASSTSRTTRGALTGTVDIDRVPQGMSASKGVFNLFKADGKAASAPKGLFKYFRSAAADTGGPQALRLRGRLRARGQALLSRRPQGRAPGRRFGRTPPRSTRACTKAPTRLARSIGAGVLTLGVDDLAALLEHRGGPQRQLRSRAAGGHDALRPPVPRRALGQLRPATFPGCPEGGAGDGFRRNRHRQRLRRRGQRLPAGRGRLPRAGARARPALGCKDLPAQGRRSVVVEQRGSRALERLARPARLPAHGGGPGRRRRRRLAHLRQHLGGAGQVGVRQRLAARDHLGGAGAALRDGRARDERAAGAGQPMAEEMQLMREGAEAIGAGAASRSSSSRSPSIRNGTIRRPSAFDVRHSKRFTNAQGVEQGTCVHLGNCDIGCEVDARNTLDRNYLALAERKGADVRPLHLVTNIEPAGGGYKVSYDRLERGRRIAGIGAGAPRGRLPPDRWPRPSCCCAAATSSGTLPNVSGRLGYNWSSNGDFLTPAFYPSREVQPTQGPTITSAINFLDGSQGGKVVLDPGRRLAQPGRQLDRDGQGGRRARAGFPAVHASRLCASWARWRMSCRGSRRASTPPTAGSACAGAGGCSASTSSISTGTVKESAPGDRGDRRHAQEAFEGDRGAPRWCRRPGRIDKFLITRIRWAAATWARRAKNGVVDHKGEVFGYRNLFVIDGAIVPEALGVNPSRSIAALAERAVGTDRARGSLAGSTQREQGEECTNGCPAP